MNESYELLNNFANGDETIYAPEIIYACEEIKAPVDYKLIEKLVQRLEQMNNLAWPVYALGLVNLFKLADNEDTVISSLGSIIKYEMTSCNNDADRAYGWSIRAKSDAIKFLSNIYNDEAILAIAEGLKFYVVNYEAKIALQKTTLGRSLLLEHEKNIKKNNPISNIDNEIPKVVEKVKKINLDEVKILNYQNGPNPIITEIRGRKKHSFKSRKIREKDGDGFFTCPFCGNLNDINGKWCKHAVFGYETVSGLVLDSNESFVNIILRLISTEPNTFIEDFGYYLEEYIYSKDFKNKDTKELRLDDLKSILEDKISPDVLYLIFEKFGVPITMRSLTEFSLIDDYMGCGMYCYLVSDEDLTSINSSHNSC